MQFRKNLLALAIATIATGLPATTLAQSGNQQGSMELAQASSQAGTISGRITSDRTGNPLQGAVVGIESLNISDTTDSEGRFRLPRLSPGTYEVTVRYVDRETETRSITIGEGAGESLNIAMRRAEASNIDEIVVFGTMIADSEAAALQRQLAGNNVANILASDSIGRFPDQNAADALGRVPGISIERDQGQARYVNVRGAPADFSSIAFNGVSAPTPSTGGRSARFDTISNDVIKSIEIVKAVTPDIPADSIGGYINVETNGAFDRPGFNIDAAIGQGIKELGGGRLENYQLTLSNTFFDDTVGILVSGSLFSDEKITDNIENNFRVESDDQVWTREADYRLYRLNRENESLNVRMDWRPTAMSEFYINYVASEFSDFEMRDKHVYDLDDSHFGHIRSRAGFDPGLSDPVKGTVLGVGLDADFNTRTDLESIQTSQFGGSFNVGELYVDWVGGLNRSESERQPNSAYWEYEIPRYRATSDTDPTPRDPGISVTYDYTDPDWPIVEVFDTKVNPDGSLALGDRLNGPPIDYFQFENVETSDTLGRVDDLYFQTDAEFPWSPMGITSELKFGGRASRREATLRDTDLEVDTRIDGLGVDTSYAAILSDHASRARFPQPGMMEFSKGKALTQREAAFAAARANGHLLTQSNLWSNFYNVDEDVYALYAMNTFNFDRFDIIAGARVEYTRMNGVGLRTSNEDAIDDILEEGSREIVLDDLFAARDANGNPILERFSAKKDYVDIFPALHINYRPNEDMVLRLAYTESILRPSYGQFAPNQEVGDDSDLAPGGLINISGGNPDLDPYHSRNIDAYAEWYLPYRGILSAGIFAKWIDDPIFGATQTVDGAPFGFPDNQVRLSGPLNGSDGEIRGVELNYSQQFGFLPGHWDGIGVSLNYTYSDDSATTPPLFNPETGENDGASRETGLSGASSTTYNASVFYEKFGVSTRLSYQYRSTWLNSIDLGEPRLDRFWDDRPSLDLSFRYSINDNWMLYLDANNLSDEYGRRYNGERKYVYEVEGFGRSYMAGVRMSF
ncbi:MAG: TonB-dependent receptor [Pseudomonadota bacterium]